MLTIKNTDVMQSCPNGGMNMSKVSFIIEKDERNHQNISQKLFCEAKKALMLGIMVVVLSFLPFPTAPFLSNNTIVAQAKETDTESLDNIRLNIKSEKTLLTGETSTLRVYNLLENHKVTFRSSDAEVVTVEKEDNNTLILTGQGVGTAEVVVFVKNGFWKVKTMKIRVVVGPPVQSVKFVESKIVLKVGEKTTVRAILKPSNTVEKGKYKSEDSSIASVTTSTGCVTGKSVGTVTITIVTDTGATDECTIEVVEE